MTAREIKLAKKMLEILHDRDGRAMAKNDLLAELAVAAQCSLGEAKGAFALCDARGWLNGVPSEFAAGKSIVAVNDEGEIALQKLSQP